MLNLDDEQKAIHYSGSINEFVNDRHYCRSGIFYK